MLRTSSGTPSGRFVATRTRDGWCSRFRSTRRSRGATRHARSPVHRYGNPDSIPYGDEPVADVGRYPNGPRPEIEARPPARRRLGGRDHSVRGRQPLSGRAGSSGIPRRFAHRGPDTGCGDKCLDSRSRRRRFVRLRIAAEGTGRRFRVEFDLSRTVPAPPAPWGAEATSGIFPVTSEQSATLASTGAYHAFH